MYSWKTIRTVCSVLLLLPVVHLAYLISRNTMETMDNSPETWNREVDAYAVEDTRRHLPDRPIVVVGGSRVKLWRGLEDLLAPTPVLMRGIGDAIVDDIVHHYPRLVGFYQPDTVVLLPGNSEFHLRDNKSARELATGIEELVELDASHGITRRFYVFTPVKTPLYRLDHETIDQTRHRLDSLAASDERVVILDANSLLAGPDGTPGAHYFRADGVNLNEHGYLRLSVLLQSQVEADTPVPQGPAASP